MIRHPFPSNVIIFFLVVAFAVRTVQAQQRCGTSRRRAWRDLSCSEQRDYLNAVQALKDNGVYDEFVRVHWDSRDRAHGVPEFLPWHRWFLWVFERELQQVSGSCSIVVPYWDWERGDSLPIILKASTFGARNGGGCVPNGIAVDWDPAQPGERCLVREFDTDWSLSRDTEVLSRITNFETFSRFGDALEGAPHAGPHEFIGGPMAIDWSPDDPLFWVHHSNVDRIWALWQDYRGHDDISDPNEFGRIHFSSDLDRPLVIFQGSQVDFNDPRTGRPPTPRELLTSRNGPLVDVQYVNDSLARLLWESSSSFRSGGNNQAWIVPATGTVRERCSGSAGSPVGPSAPSPPAPSPPAPSPPAPSSCQSLGSSCNSNQACCSGICGFESRTCASAPSSSSCRGTGRGCSSNDSCCSGFCSPRSGRCASSCLGRGSRCDDSSDCCSRVCNRFGRCSGNTNRRQNRNQKHERELVADHGKDGRQRGRVLTDKDVKDQDDGNDVFGDDDDDDDVVVLYRDEPLDFSGAKVKTRWYDLMAQYPDDPAVVWDMLAREDCQDRAAALNHSIQSASPKWMAMMHMDNNTRVFDCHYDDDDDPV